jgi:hypothetical protein
MNGATRGSHGVYPQRGDGDKSVSFLLRREKRLNKTKSDRLSRPLSFVEVAKRRLEDPPRHLRHAVRGSIHLDARFWRIIL